MEYKMKFKKIFEDLEIKKGDVEKKVIYVYLLFVEFMLDYIINDF